MDADYAAIREGLQRLREYVAPLLAPPTPGLLERPWDRFTRSSGDPRPTPADAALPEVFGWQAHEFLTHPPLPEQVVREFEELNRIKLPAEYRGFLMHVGNGGAGPAYGLFKLGEMDENFGHRSWSQMPGFVGDLAAAFPHTDAWNDLSGQPEYDEAIEQDLELQDAYGEKVDAWEEHFYWNPVHVNGAIPICHLGCAQRQWLVVTGPESGNVWDDARADYGGLKPVQRPGMNRITFLQWYRSWLEGALAQLGNRKAEPGVGADSR